jgi:uncharacterized membrane protein (UPF0127 family)
VSTQSHFLEPLLKAATVRPRLVNDRTGAVIAGEIELAADSGARNRGLLGRSGIAAGSVMIIAPCNAIHTFFMQFTIDLVFADRHGRVVKLYRSVRPWRIRVSLGAFAALELAEGSIETADVATGDPLSIQSD